VNRTVALNAVAIIGILFVTSAVWSSEQPSSTQRIPQFENSHVKVWRSTIVPNAPLPLHRHDHGRVIIALQGGTMKRGSIRYVRNARLGDWKSLLAAGESSQYHAQGH
jgi:hypothetical protein